MSPVICARIQSCRRRLCPHKSPHDKNASCMLKRDLGGLLRRNGLRSHKCRDKDCIALDTMVFLKGEQAL